MKALSAITRTALALLVGGATLIFSSVPPFGPFVIQAEARIGRPATPMSYAGVARRTTRRAAGYGVAAGAAAAGGYYYYNNATPGCAQAVNPYGQIVYQCP